MGISLHANAETPAVTSSLSVSPDGSQLSATFERTSLWQVLETLAGPLTFRAHIDPSLAPLPVTATLKQVSIDDVLDRLLTGVNYAWIGRDLYVWPRENTSNSLPLDTDHWTVVAAQQPVVQAPPSLDSLQTKAAEAEDPADRLEALETLMQIGDEDTVVSALQAALTDDDTDVRTLALVGLEEVDGPEIHQAIIHVAQHDSAPENRAYGLVWLTEHQSPEAIGILKAALQDDDPNVQELAQEILADLQGAERDEE